MAAYPSYPQLDTTTIRGRSGVQIDIMESGVLRGSDSYDNPVADIVVEHFLTSTDLNSLYTFWSDNRGVFVTFTYDGDSSPSRTYEGIIFEITDRWHASGNYFATVKMTANEFP